MDKFVELSREEAMQLRDALLAADSQLYKLRVYTGSDGAKFKVNEYIWSPPMGKLVQTQ